MLKRFVTHTTLMASLWLGGCRDFSAETETPLRETSHHDASVDETVGDPDGFDAATSETPETSRPAGEAGSMSTENDSPTGAEAGATAEGGVSNHNPPPFDWSSALDALYTFEDASALGLDSSGHGLHLSVAGTVELSDEHAQGASSALFAYAKGSGLWSNDIFFRTLPGKSFSVGAWLKASVSEGDYLVFFNGGQVQGGFSLAIGVGTSTVSCVIADGSGEYAYAGSGQISDFQLWTHVVCRYEHSAQTTQLFVNGVPLVPAVETPAGIAQGTGRLSLGQGFDGHLDEAFFVHRALSDAQITRIWGCGVDGKKCACSEMDSSAYAKCGPFSDCEFTTLPACDVALVSE